MTFQDIGRVTDRSLEFLVHKSIYFNNRRCNDETEKTHQEIFNHWNGDIEDFIRENKFRGRKDVTKEEIEEVWKRIKYHQESVNAFILRRYFEGRNDVTREELYRVRRKYFADCFEAWQSSPRFPFSALPTLESLFPDDTIPTMLWCPFLPGTASIPPGMKPWMQVLKIFAISPVLIQSHLILAWGLMIGKIERKLRVRFAEKEHREYASREEKMPALSNDEMLKMEYEKYEVYRGGWGDRLVLPSRKIWGYSARQAWVAAVSLNCFLVLATILVVIHWGKGMHFA